MIKVSVIDVLRDARGQTGVVLLHEASHRVMLVRSRFLDGALISWIGSGAPWIWDGPRRPLTYHFAQDILTHTRTAIEAVAIGHLKDGVYHGVLQLQSEEPKTRVNARPSDALALAMLMNAPVYADFEREGSVLYDMDDLYRGPIGKSFQIMVDAMRAFWDSADSRVYLNAIENRDLQQADAGPETDPVRLTLLDVLSQDETTKTVVFLDKKSRLLLPIQMASWEADSLAWAARGTLRPSDHPKQPEIYHVLSSILDFTGSEVKNAQIRDLQNGIFYSGVQLLAGGRKHNIDARPVDAAALAFLLGKPLYTSAGVMNAAGVKASDRYRSRKEIGQALKTLYGNLEQDQVQHPNPEPATPVQRLFSLLRRGE